MLVLSQKSDRATAARRGRGWGRSILLAIAVHFLLGVVAWRVAVRVGLWGDQNPASAPVLEANRRPQIPLIMPAVETINSGPARMSILAYHEGEEALEWKSTPHERVGVDWSGENAPLIGIVDRPDDWPGRLKGGVRNLQ